MKEIWKFEVGPRFSDVEMPRDARVLSAQVQHGKLCVWALVNPENTKVKRQFLVLGTGHPAGAVETLNLIFVDTVQMDGGAYIFHVFVEPE